MPTTDTRRDVNALRKPYDDEVDVYGLTHPGKVRASNQDHFLICSVRKQVQVLPTSLPAVTRVPLTGDRMAFLAEVADGVGGGPKGEAASRLALEQITEYVALTLRANAMRNPKAVMRTPLTMVGYLQARMVRDPLCTLDMDVPVDGADAFVLSTGAQRESGVERSVGFPWHWSSSLAAAVSSTACRILNQMWQCALPFFSK